MAARKRREAIPMAIHDSWFDTPTMLEWVSHECKISLVLALLTFAAMSIVGRHR